MTHPLHAAHMETRMFTHGYWNRQGAYRAGISLRSLLPLTVQLFVLQLRHTLLAGSLVLLSMGPLAVHAAVLDEAAGRAVLQLHYVAGLPAAVGAAAIAFTTHFSGRDEVDRSKQAPPAGSGAAVRAGAGCGGAQMRGQAGGCSDVSDAGRCCGWRAAAGFLDCGRWLFGSLALV